MILHLESPSICSRLHTELGGAENYILSIFFFFLQDWRYLDTSETSYRSFGINVFHLLWHNILMPSSYPIFTDFRVKSTIKKSPYTLYRRSLAADQHQSVPQGNSGELIYKSLPSYTQQGCAQDYLSDGYFLAKVIQNYIKCSISAVLCSDGGSKLA